MNRGASHQARHPEVDQPHSRLEAHRQAKGLLAWNATNCLHVVCGNGPVTNETPLLVLETVSMAAQVALEALRLAATKLREAVLAAAASATVRRLSRHPEHAGVQARSRCAHA